MKYESQKIAQNFYAFAVILFLVQALVGIIAAVQFIWPDFFILNFKRPALGLIGETGCGSNP